MIPARLIKPNEGRSPTVPVTLAGARIEPLVSEPSAKGANPAATAAADPLLEPEASRLVLRGFSVCPPNEL
ncbi:hypothetical protein D9M69_602550 [compost metagenome]